LARLNSFSLEVHQSHIPKCPEVRNMKSAMFAHGHLVMLPDSFEPSLCIEIQCVYVCMYLYIAYLYI